MSSTVPLNSTIDDVGDNATLRPLYPRERDALSTAHEAGPIPEPVCMGAEISPPLGFDPRIVQPVASRYLWHARQFFVVIILDTSYYFANTGPTGKR
jgi:hypothetical protein